MEEKIKQLGWWFSISHGGWVHEDVRDDDGKLRSFDTAADVARYIEVDADA